ncbi:hypothetical protein Peur_022650 [Populus x canadensis]
MAENHPLNIGFQVDSIVAQQAIFALFMDTLSNQIQVKYQPMRVSPFDTHQRVMSTFLLLGLYTPQHQLQRLYSGRRNQSIKDVSAIFASLLAPLLQFCSW